MLLCYQVNQQIQQGKFPITLESALEIITLKAQVITIYYSHFTTCLYFSCTIFKLVIRYTGEVCDELECKKIAENEHHLIR